jgi:Rap1a immunity proteins
MGMIEGMGLQQGLDGKPSSNCVPKDVTLGQTVRVVVKYMDDHPEETHQSFVAFVYDATRKAWPCKP